MSPASFLAPASAAGPWQFPDNCRVDYYHGWLWAETEEDKGCWRTQAGISYRRADTGNNYLQVSGWSTYPTSVTASFDWTERHYSRHYGDATSADCCYYWVTWNF